jgi:transposase-like protein
MAKKGYTPEQIINKLREAEILLSQGETVAVVSKKIGVSSHTYYRWRREYGGAGQKAQRSRERKYPPEEAGG